MTTARTRQLRRRGHLLRRVVVILFALVAVGILADRAITPLMPRSWRRGTLTGVVSLGLIALTFPIIERITGPEVARNE